MLFSVAVCAQDAFSPQIMSIPLSDDTELQVQHYPAQGDSLLIILPSEHGLTDGLQTLAKTLSQSGIEIWIADPFSTWFLPTVASSLQEIPVSAYAELIARAEKTTKKIYLLTNDKGTGPLLESLYAWQSVSQGIITGVILISPELYMKTPSPGNNGQFLSVAETSNLPVFIFVPAKSTLALRINDTVKALEKGGSDVYIQVLPEVRNRFFFRSDATKMEQISAQALPKKIVQSMKLTRTFAKSRILAKPIVRVKLAKPGINDIKKTTGLLREYQGNLEAEDFVLNDSSGVSHSLSQYLGKVVIVNFWASWCPPCVHEMPSMTRLNDDLSDQPFSILAINLGEAPDDIKRFLNTYPVSFPILLDPQQKLTKKWKVFAFPTSYLLDKNGTIRYSVAGGIDWNSTESRKVVNSLLISK